MQEKEREELINVLGLEEAVKKAQKEDSSAANTVIDTAELDSDSDDEVLLPYTAKEDDHIWVSSDEGDVEVVGSAPSGAGGGSKRKAADGLDLSGPRGWGECPVCDQMMPLSKLQLHAMACQGLGLNGGNGLEVILIHLYTVGVLMSQAVLG